MVRVTKADGYTVDLILNDLTSDERSYLSQYKAAHPEVLPPEPVLPFIPQYSGPIFVENSKGIMVPEGSEWDDRKTVTPVPETQAEPVTEKKFLDTPDYNKGYLIDYSPTNTGKTFKTAVFGPDTMIYPSNGTGKVKPSTDVSGDKWGYDAINTAGLLDGSIYYDPDEGRFEKLGLSAPSQARYVSDFDNNGPDMPNAIESSLKENYPELLGGNNGSNKPATTPGDISSPASWSATPTPTATTTPTPVNHSILDSIFPSAQASQMDEKGNLVPEPNPAALAAKDAFNITQGGLPGFISVIGSKVDVGKTIKDTGNTIDGLLGSKLYLNDVAYRDPFGLYGSYFTMGQVNEDFRKTSSDVRNGINSHIESSRSKNEQLINSIPDNQWMFGKTQKDLALLGNNLDLGVIAPAYVNFGTGAVEGVVTGIGGVAQMGAGAGLIGEMYVQDRSTGKTNVGSGVLRAITGGTVGEKTVTKTVEYGEPTSTQVTNPDGSITTTTTTPYTIHTQTNEKRVPSLIDQLGGIGSGVADDFATDPAGAVGRNVIPLLLMGKTGGKVVGKGKVGEAAVFEEAGFVKGGDVISGPMRNEGVSGKTTPSQFSRDGFVDERGNVIGADKYSNLKLDYDYGKTDSVVTKKVSRDAPTGDYVIVNKNLKTDSFGIRNGDEIGLGDYGNIGKTIINTGEKAVGYASIGVGAGYGNELVSKYGETVDEIVVDDYTTGNNINEITLPGEKTINSNKTITDNENIIDNSFGNRNAFISDNSNVTKEVTNNDNTYEPWYSYSDNYANGNTFENGNTYEYNNRHKTSTEFDKFPELRLGGFGFLGGLGSGGHRKTGLTRSWTFENDIEGLNPFGGTGLDLDLKDPFSTKPKKKTGKGKSKGKNKGGKSWLQ
ncbi:hypothetical protein [Methanocella sp. MCL-LM]|uniref:hypothetical protein n=1 Tax=Methanocella sp. MCL-LM TaxID=3412035 RepID=UPI003C758A9B